ncbi:MAG: hypothetical protein KJ947_10595 [Alphaproteobacteria bacterium]|jgi:hypothetical protein|nr:hypothetical protein [Alphaproteobacteria bacterium]MBU1550007.1 hypothetical protein [Alphaproteobacteria bacterium]MBU2337191.1 hypothetical protein [Alphaproteobacteria bacterium]MBU2389522.1 hypothetical protein [Alphaproteobacteria bacterium]|tara:strand:- start:412 stop:705 length:294 start_codon:yes stop_codon:yes gene_type:complete
MPKSTVKQILPVSGSWFRVLGTKDNPVLERIVFWALVNTEKTDVIVGVPRQELGVIGAVDGWLEDVAGYIEVPAEDVDRLIKHPEELAQFELVWAEE